MTTEGNSVPDEFRHDGEDHTQDEPATTAGDGDRFLWSDDAAPEVLEIEEDPYDE